jgi:SAM-dependent methyltransferase
VSVPTGNTYDKEATTNPAERRMVDGFARALRSLLPDTAARVLEIGCGEGSQLRKVGAVLPGAHLTGLDLPDAELAARWEGIDATMVHGSADSLPWPDSTFDLVLALEVLEHLDDPERAVGEIARVARGAVVLSVPWEPVWRAGNLLRGRYLGALGNTPGHVGHFSRRSFLRLVRRELVVDEVCTPLPWTMVRARVPA